MPAPANVSGRRHQRRPKINVLTAPPKRHWERDGIQTGYGLSAGQGLVPPVPGDRGSMPLSPRRTAGLLVSESLRCWIKNSGGCRKNTLPVRGLCVPVVGLRVQLIVQTPERGKLERTGWRSDSSPQKGAFINASRATER